MRIVPAVIKRPFVVLCIVIAIGSILFPLWVVVPSEGGNYTNPPQQRSVIWRRPPVPPDWSGRTVIDIQATFGAAVLPIVRIFFVFAVFGIAVAGASQKCSPAWKAYGGAVAAAGVLAVVAHQSYGTHTEDADPMFGGGEVVEDFTPTSHERNKWGWTVFIFIAIPALTGTFVGRRRFLDSEGRTRRCS
jgi:hypothetical protein